MENLKLFDIPPTLPSVPENTCKNCKHRQPWQCGLRVIQYCGIRRSNRTNNGLLKIRCKDGACKMFEKEDNND